MKKTLLLVFSLAGVVLYAQNRVQRPASMRNNMVTAPVRKAVKDNCNFMQTVNQYMSPQINMTETEIGKTVYDLQSNTGSPSGRCYLYPDGRAAAVWTRGMTPTTYSDRGTGYNSYDGNNWGPEPTARIESQRTGWPGYAPLGVNGEIVVAHHDSQGLVVTKRSAFGTGAWSSTILAGPTGAVDISWPRVVTSGANHDTVHVIATTYSAYAGQNLALLYYRSTDGGATWSTKHYIDPSMDATHYYGFSGDSYAWAEPHGNNLAFLIADSQEDLFVRRSSDAGTTWQKTVIWDHPYPLLNVSTTATDTLYAPDGAAHLSFDRAGKLHIVFGIYRVLFNGDGTYSYWPGLSGIGYWNDSQPTFTGGDQKKILNPDSLDAQGKLVGTYLVDWNGNGTLDILADYGNYGLGFASMPQISFDRNTDNAILIYSSLTEGFNNGTQNYRHIWSRASSDDAQNWGQIIDLDSDPIHIFDECVFPCISQTGDNTNWYFQYQLDNEPGLAIRGDLDPPGDNNINFYPITTLYNGIPQISKPSADKVSANYPNPFTGITSVDLSLEKTSAVSYTVSNVTGQVMVSENLGKLSSGKQTLRINGSGLSAGVYFLRVLIGEQQYTNKFVVR